MLKYHMSRYPILPQELFIENRRRLVSLLKKDSIAIVHSNYVFPASADENFPFKQNSDLLWLTGINQPNTTLVFFIDKFGSVDEYIFVDKTDPNLAVWEGDKLTVDQVRDISGIQNVEYTDNFDSFLEKNVFRFKNIYLDFNEHLRASREILNQNERKALYYKEKYPLHNFERLAPLISDLRQVKLDFEIEIIKDAVRITKDIFDEILKIIRPGMSEFEIEALITYMGLKNGAYGNAFPPIVAGGINSCILHYQKNENILKEGDIVLLDFGINYGFYNSDITRVVPVSGKFTDRQKDIYSAVLDVQRQAMAFLKPNVTYEDYEKFVGSLIEEKLIELDLITIEDVKNQNPQNPVYRKYYMHRTSHFLGMDVHDVNVATGAIKVGTVLTCEPGIYVREESIGVRLEEDIVITDNGTENLTASIPIDPDHIEEIMNNR